MRGRKPKPTARKKLEGNPGKRALNKHEPKLPEPPAEFDAAPSELGNDPVSCGEWRRLAPLLRLSRTVTEADRGALLALCQQWSTYQQANGKVATAGMVVKSPSGYPMPNPYISIANKALGICIKLWAELGMTPSSRSRVSAVGEPNAADPFAEFDGPLKEFDGAVN